MSHFLEKCLPYLPYITFIAFAIGICLVVALGFLARHYIQRQIRNRTLSRMPDTNPEPWYKNPLWIRLKEWCAAKRDAAKYSITKPGADDLTMSFQNAEKILKTYLNQGSPLYDLPWFLVLGPSNSGKSTLLHDADLDLPIGRPESDHETYVKWSFFDRGIALDVSGHLFLESNTTESDAANWDYFCRLLCKTRTRRPLDGIILTIPASDLLNSDATSSANAKDRAHKMAEKLNHLQKITGMKVPVYTIITKCDLIPGFQGFTSELPPENRSEMLGWSCPYAIESSYNTDWANDIFTGIHRCLDKMRLALFSVRQDIDLEQDVFLFPRHFLSLKQNFSIYLDGIFKDTAYNESFFLRGVYLTGENKESGQSLSFGTARQNRVFFIKDLFERKIFSEWGLGQPILRILVSSNKLLTISKAFSGSAALIWVLGLIYSGTTLRDNLKNIEPTLSEIHLAIHGLAERGGATDDPKTLAYLNHEADRILELFTNVDTVQTASFFMPSSWVSNLDDRIRASMTAAYDRIILPSLYTGLKDRGRVIVSSHKSFHGKSTSQTPSDLNPQNPTALASFKTLQDYLQDLSAFEKAANLYNNLENSSSVEDLGTLIKYIYDKSLPAQFYSQTDYYKKALSKTSERPLNLADFKEDAGKKLGFLFRDFLDAAFDSHKSLSLFDTLSRRLSQLSHTHTARRMDDGDLRSLAEESIAVADILAVGALSWVNGETFDPNPAYGELMRDIGKLDLLGTDVSGEITAIANRSFTQFKRIFQTFKSDLTGTFLTIQDGQLIANPSPGLVNFIDALTSFLDEPFMVQSETRSLNLKIPPGKLLFWDDVTLEKAVKFIDGYEGYLRERLPQLPPHLQTIFRLIGRNSVRQKVTDSVAASQIFHDAPTGMAGFGIREMLGSQVHNMSTITPFFVKILGVFDDGGYVDTNAKLRELLIQQNYQLLERIETLLESDNLYAAQDEAFLWWDGSPMLGLKAFSVHDIGDMKNYLKAQRHRITFFAKELAEPILSLLSLGYLENVPYDLPLALRWTRIVTALDRYETQSPGNSLRRLEQFLTYDINEINLDTCSDLDKDNGFSGDDFDGASDYFSEIQDRLSGALKRRCAVISSKQSIDRYNKAATFFNVNLAGRFPFTKTALATGGFEAEPEDVQTFFGLYDQLTERDVKILKKASSFVGSTMSIDRFIRDVESARPFLLASLNGDMDKSIPHLNLDVMFRTDRDLEQGGDQIIDWQIQIGGDKHSFRDGQNAPLTWRTSMPILVDFKWALDGDNLPMADPQIPDLLVNGLRASFLYEGRWSLVQLLRRHTTPPSQAGSSGPQPLVLEFKIPTLYSPECLTKKDRTIMEKPSEDARLFLRFGVSQPKSAATDGKPPVSAEKARYLSMPSFPIEAPVLEQISLHP